MLASKATGGSMTDVAASAIGWGDSKARRMSAMDTQ